MPSRHWISLLAAAAAVWLPIAAATTGLAILAYAAGQHVVRLGADDVPTALAQDVAGRLNGGATPTTVVSPAGSVDIASTLDPFVLVYDAQGHLLAGSASLQGQPPVYPTGVFDAVRASGQDRVTWQPAPGVREATVAVPWQGGFVVAGQSLLLPERRIDSLGQIALAGWLGTLAAIAAACLLVTYLRSLPLSLSTTAPATAR